MPRGRARRRLGMFPCGQGGWGFPTERKFRKLAHGPEVCRKPFTFSPGLAGVFPSGLLPTVGSPLQRMPAYHFAAVRQLVRRPTDLRWRGQHTARTMIRIELHIALNYRVE